MSAAGIALRFLDLCLKKQRFVSDVTLRHFFGPQPAQGFCGRRIFFLGDVDLGLEQRDGVNPNTLRKLLFQLSQQTARLIPIRFAKVDCREVIQTVVRETELGFN